MEMIRFLSLMESFYKRGLNVQKVENACDLFENPRVIQLFYQLCEVLELMLLLRGHPRPKGLITFQKGSSLYEVQSSNPSKLVTIKYLIERKEKKRQE